MAVFERAAVVGLGLIGGSVARDLNACGTRVTGYDTDADHLASALAEGVVHGVLDESLSGVCDAELVVVAVPVDAALDVLRRIAPFTAAARLITDVGSTKVRIAGAARALGLGDRFVGSHPMAGDHRSGWGASRTGMFAGAPVYVCPSDDARPCLVDLTEAFWSELGARPVRMSSARHDETLAWTSHLPHMVAAALALALAQNGVARSDLGTGGRDATRLAGSSPDVWTAIAAENAGALDRALAAVANEIATIRGALEHVTHGELRDRLAAARNWFQG